MKTPNHSFHKSLAGAAIGALALLAGHALAAVPVVKTVPWVSANPLIPHSTYTGKTVTLKGTADQQGADIQWIWDFGDGTPVATGTVTDRYAISATHAYTAPPGTTFTARLTVRNTSTGEAGSRAYYVQVLEKSLQVEANIAIDEGLWYLHKSQHRFVSGGVDYGDWAAGLYGGYAASGWHGVSAANTNAFQVNGHLQTSSPDNPYTETVGRAMRRLFTFLGTRAIGNQAAGNPDTNGNGLGVYVQQGYSYYQGGMFIDAIVASGTPNAMSTTGPVGVIGRTFADIVQDMVDDHAWAQYDIAGQGGWRYNANEFPDNSACQWAAIGLLAAERNWGLIVPAWVKERNIPWLTYTQAANGSFGYTSASSVWGPYATTPSGMVQMALDGIGRDMSGVGWPKWNAAEGFLYDNFVSTASGAGSQIKDYYYGLFSFVKSMLLHRTDLDGDGDLEPDPITLLRKASDPSKPGVDWYAAQKSLGHPTDGVARTLIGDQSSGGYWWGHNYSGDQYPFETAWAIMMLQQTLFESGAPVAVAKALPNPVLIGQNVLLDGSDSYHQDANKLIDSWEWDSNGDGVFESTGPYVSTLFDSLGLFPVTLRVTDNGSPERSAQTIINVLVSTPPAAPTADADGPYNFCPQAGPWFLNGSRSINPDEGRSQPHDPPYPGDTIQEYAWDLDGDNEYDDAFGPTPDVTDWFSALGPGEYLIGLRVTDTSATSYPDSTVGDLSDITTAQVFVKAASNPDCACVTLTATPEQKAIRLSWGPLDGAASYNVYRGTTSGGPYTWIASVEGTTHLDEPGALPQVYSYVVRPAALNGDELCQSNEAQAEPLHPGPTVTVTPKKVSNLAKYYYLVDASSTSFGHFQLGIYVGDTASSFVSGPYPPGSLLYLRGNQRTASARPGSGSIGGYIMVKGQARVWAVDPIGQSSAVIVVP